MTVKCFTCPRERRGDEAGWHFVDLPARARASGPPRIFVCPRHYGHFAERERGRWTEFGAPTLDAAPVLVATAVQPAAWTDVNGALDVNAAPAAAIGLIDTIASNS
ncbi:MAG TPA: hypothetical protein VGX75_09195 [bacterium]|nr:hypothetical protein [bacterium]